MHWSLQFPELRVLIDRKFKHKGDSAKVLHLVCEVGRHAHAHTDTPHTHAHFIPHPLCRAKGCRGHEVLHSAMSHLQCKPSDN